MLLARAGSAKPIIRGRRHGRLLTAATAVLVVLVAGGLWVRDSPLVAVRDVTVTGLTGAEAPRARAALTAAAKDMSTLHVRLDALRSAAAPFDSIATLEADGDPPHTLRIDVRAHDPVLAVEASGHRIPVASDGTLLRDLGVRDLPVLRLRTVPGGDRLTGRLEEAVVRLLSAAPSALRARARRVFSGPRGLTVDLGDGPRLAFGGGTALGAKWAAAARVLADPSAAGATYLDVRLPERPAVGGGAIPTPPSAST